MTLEESVCRIEIKREDDEFVALVETELGGLREFRRDTIEVLLKDLVNDLEDEFEGAPRFNMPIDEV